MNCIIVDDEPLAREAIEILVKDTSQLNLTGMFNNAIGASKFMEYLLDAPQSIHTNQKLHINSAARYWSTFRAVLHTAYRDRKIKENSTTGIRLTNLGPQ